MDNVEIRIFISEEGLVIMTSPATPVQLRDAANQGDGIAAIAVSLFAALQRWGADLNAGNDPMTHPNG